MPKEMHSPQHIVALLGPSGSGKSTITQQVISTFGKQVERLKNITSREKRITEQQESDYIHLTKDACKKILAQEKAENIVEWTNLGGNYYILPRPTTPFGIISLTPSGIAEAQKWGQEHGVSVTTIGLKTKNTTCKKRMQTRGDDALAIQKRLSQDQALFSESAYNLCDFTINSEQSIEEVCSRVNFIISSLLELGNKAHSS